MVIAGLSLNHASIFKKVKIPFENNNDNKVYGDDAR